MSSGSSAVGAARARGELLGALTLAIDLGLGMPAEHVVRSALCAHRLAGAMGLPETDRRAAFHTTMVMWIGCHADSHEYARWFGDDIATRRASYQVDWAGLSYTRFLAARAGRGTGPIRRVATVLDLGRNVTGVMKDLAGSHCTSAALFAEQLELGGAVEYALAGTYERWDGRGGPLGISGEQLPPSTRISQVADVAQARFTADGAAEALRLVRSRAGGQLDPDIVAVLADHADEVLVDQADDVWAQSAAIAPEPAPVGHLDRLIESLGRFADVKSPWTLGHSAAVATLTEAAARHAGASPSERERIRRAAHLHDLGRIGVSNQVWDKVGPLRAADIERVHMHPYLTGRILHKVESLADVASLAANHHERLDGSGYPLGLTGANLTLADQLLAAADTFHTAVEPRPHRPANSRAEAATMLRSHAAAGRLSGDAVRAVLTAAGENPTVRQAWPDGLTGREVEILRLVARARTTTQIAHDLNISTKTVRNHIDHVFTKTGTSNRVGVSIYAMQHGLAGP